MIQTLVPAPIRAAARGRRFGYALTPRALLLLVAGCLLAVPGFFHPRPLLGWIWAMVAWDALVLLLAILDAAMLPAPAKITVERRFENSPVLGERTEITIEVTQESNQILEMRVTDALDPALDAMPAAKRVLAYPRDAARVMIECTPNARGDVALGEVFPALSRSVEAGGTVGVGGSAAEYPGLSADGEIAGRYATLSVTNTADCAAEAAAEAARAGAGVRKPAGISERG